MPVTPTTYAHDFAGVLPPARFDGTPWTIAHIEQATADTGPWTELAPIAIAHDPTPSSPDALDIEVVDATLERGYFRFQFEDAIGTFSEHLPARFSPNIPALANAYCSADQLRDALDNASISDDAALKIIAGASVIVDRLVGPIPIDPISGQKIRVAGLLQWQRDKLADATTTLGVVLFTTPNAFRQTGNKLVQGPDFRTEYRDGSATVSPAAAYALRAAASLLDDAHIRRLIARMFPA